MFCFNFIYMGVLPMCMSVYHVHAAPEEARRGWCTMGLELEMVRNHYVELGLLEEHWVLLTTESSSHPTSRKLIFSPLRRSQQCFIENRVTVSCRREASKIMGCPLRCFCAGIERRLRSDFSGDLMASSGHHGHYIHMATDAYAGKIVIIIRP